MRYVRLYLTALLLGLLIACGKEQVKLPLIHQPTEQQGSRIVSQPNLVLTYVDGPRLEVDAGVIVGVTFTVWLRGDANGDLSVDFADVNSLVSQFGSSRDLSEGFLSMDLNRDGSVGFADVNLFVSAFGVRIGGFHVYQDLTPDPQTLEAELGTASSPNFDLEVSSTPEGYTRYFFQPPAGKQGWLRVVPLDPQGNELVELASSVTRVKNLPPEVTLSVDRSLFFIGDQSPPQIARFDAAGSFDPEGGPLEFAWDPEGDGSFTPFGPQPILEFDYSNLQGEMEAAVRVRDGEGDISEASVTVRSFKYQWHKVSNRASFMMDIDCAIIEGKPAVAFMEDRQTPRRVMVGLPSGVELPTSDQEWLVYELDRTASGNFINYFSFAEVAGKPALAFSGDFGGQGRVKFARSTVSSPNSADDWQVYQLVTSGNSRSGIELVVTEEGLPQLIVGQSASGLISYNRGKVEEPASSTDWIGHKVPLSDVGELSAVGLVDGRPLIANLAGVALPTVRLPESQLDWTTYEIAPSWAEVAVGRNGDLPVLAWYSQDEQTIYFALATTEIPLSPGDWQIVPVVNQVETSPSDIVVGALPDGRPLVGYAVPLTLAVGKTSEPLGLGDWELHQLHQDVSLVVYLDMEILPDGRPFFCFGPSGVSFPLIP